MDIHNIIEEGKNHCRGCHTKGICVIKAMGHEEVCPCLKCIVFAMCRKNCDDLTMQMKLSNSLCMNLLNEIAEKGKEKNV